MLPEFQTERLSLRARTMADYDACLQMDNDPDVLRYVHPPWTNAAEHERFLKDRLSASLGEGLGYWSIFPNDNPRRFLGWIMLVPYDGGGPDIEIGWRLNQVAWGKGYATEAAHPVAAYAFRILGLPRLVTNIDTANLGSLRVAEKIGMKAGDTFPFDGAVFRRFTMADGDLS